MPAQVLREGRWGNEHWESYRETYRKQTHMQTSLASKLGFEALKELETSLSFSEAAKE